MKATTMNTRAVLPSRIMKATLKSSRSIWHTLATLILGCAFMFVFVHTASAQAPSPTPPAGRSGVAPQAQLETLTESARTFVPSIKRVIEGQLLRRYALLATVVAQLIMMASLIKLMTEKTGPTRDFFGFVGRAIIVLPLILTGPWLITYSYKLGQQLTSPLSSPLRDVRQNFDEQYAGWISGHFLVRDTTGTYVPLQDGRAALVGVLQDQTSPVRSVDAMFQGSFWDMPKLFTVMNIARGIIGFADFLLIVLTGFLMIAFRLAVPWMLAVCVDKSLAHEITYKFARGVIVFTLVFPVVANIMRFIGYSLGNLGMGMYDVRQPPMHYLDPRTAQIITDYNYDPTFTFGVAAFMMLVTALCLLASPVISYKIAFGQTFEGVASVASGWMAAIVGTGLNFVSAKIGAALNNAAERLHVNATADAGVITARADNDAARMSNRAGLVNQLGQINAARTEKTMLNDAGANQSLRNLQAAYRNQITNVNISREAAVGNIAADRGQANRILSNQTSREQQQALINYQTGMNSNDQSWWSWGTEAIGGVGGAVATKGAGGATPGMGVGRLASRPGEIVTDQVNIETQAMGGVGLSSQYLSRTADSNRDYEQDRTDVETVRADRTTGALTEQYNAQSGAVTVWNTEANRAAETGAGIAARAATDSTAMMNEAANTKFVGANHSIETVRQAGMQAAEYHRMSQILSQVTHDMTRRIEEMGQYRF